MNQIVWLTHVILHTACFHVNKDTYFYATQPDNLKLWLTHWGLGDFQMFFMTE